MFRVSSRVSIAAALFSVGVFVFLACEALGQSPEKLRELKAEEVAKIQEASPQAAVAKPKEARKILVFWKCNGFFHQCIPVANKAVEVMGQKTGAFKVVFSDDMAVFNADTLKDFDAVLFNNTTKLEFDDAQKKALMDFVKGGKGVIGIHAATDNFYDWPEAAEMMGGLFAGHPWTSEGTWAIAVVDAEHKVNAPFEGEGFKVKDEIYRIKQLDLRRNCHVLLRLDLSDEATRSAEGVREQDVDTPVCWVRDFENGRVFYCGLGHNNEIYYNKAIMKHVLDGIQFVLGDLEVDTTPSGPFKAEK